MRVGDEQPADVRRIEPVGHDVGQDRVDGPSGPAVHHDVPALRLDQVDLAVDGVGRQEVGLAAADEMDPLGQSHDPIVAAPPVPGGRHTGAVTRIVWRRLDVPGLEWAEIDRGERSSHLTGSAIVVEDDVSHRLEYAIELDAAGRTRKVRVDAWVGAAAPCGSSSGPTAMAAGNAMARWSSTRPPAWTWTLASRR